MLRRSLALRALLTTTTQSQPTSARTVAVWRRLASSQTQQTQPRSSSSSNSSSSSSTNSKNNHISRSSRGSGQSRRPSKFISSQQLRALVKRVTGVEAGSVDAKDLEQLRLAAINRRQPADLLFDAQRAWIDVSTKKAGDRRPLAVAAESFSFVIAMRNNAEAGNQKHIDLLEGFLHAHADVIRGSPVLPVGSHVDDPAIVGHDAEAIKRVDEEDQKRLFELGGRPLQWHLQAIASVLLDLADFAMGVQRKSHLRAAYHTAMRALRLADERWSPLEDLKHHTRRNELFAVVRTLETAMSAVMKCLRYGVRIPTTEWLATDRQAAMEEIDLNAQLNDISARLQQYLSMLDTRATRELRQRQEEVRAAGAQLDDLRQLSLMPWAAWRDAAPVRGALFDHIVRRKYRPRPQQGNQQQQQQQQQQKGAKSPTVEAALESYENASLTLVLHQQQATLAFQSALSQWSTKLAELEEALANDTSKSAARSAAEMEVRELQLIVVRMHCGLGISYSTERNRDSMFLAGREFRNALRLSRRAFPDDWRTHVYALTNAVMSELRAGQVGHRHLRAMVRELTVAQTALKHTLGEQRGVSASLPLELAMERVQRILNPRNDGQSLDRMVVLYESAASMASASRDERNNKSKAQKNQSSNAAYSLAEVRTWAREIFTVVYGQSLRSSRNNVVRSTIRRLVRMASASETLFGYNSPQAMACYARVARLVFPFTGDEMQEIEDLLIQATEKRMVEYSEKHSAKAMLGEGEQPFVSQLDTGGIPDESILDDEEFRALQEERRERALIARRAAKVSYKEAAGWLKSMDYYRGRVTKGVEAYRSLMLKKLEAPVFDFAVAPVELTLLRQMGEDMHFAGETEQWPVVAKVAVDVRQAMIDKIEREQIGFDARLNMLPIVSRSQQQEDAPAAEEAKNEAKKDEEEVDAAAESEEGSKKTDAGAVATETEEETQTERNEEAEEAKPDSKTNQEEEEEEKEQEQEVKVLDIQHGPSTTGLHFLQHKGNNVMGHRVMIAFGQPSATLGRHPITSMVDELLSLNMGYLAVRDLAKADEALERAERVSRSIPADVNPPPLLRSRVMLAIRRAEAAIIEHRYDAANELARKVLGAVKLTDREMEALKVARTIGYFRTLGGQRVTTNAIAALMSDYLSMRDMNQRRREKAARERQRIIDGEVDPGAVDAKRGDKKQDADEGVDADEDDTSADADTEAQLLNVQSRGSEFGDITPQDVLRAIGLPMARSMSSWMSHSLLNLADLLVVHGSDQQLGSDLAHALLWLPDATVNVRERLQVQARIFWLLAQRVYVYVGDLHSAEQALRARLTILQRLYRQTEEQIGRDGENEHVVKARSDLEWVQKRLRDEQ